MSPIHESQPKEIRVLFICLGNICRSPAAEEIFRQQVAQEIHLKTQIACDSAGLIDYHEGELADNRMRQAAQRRGYVLRHHSRPITENDFFQFDYIAYMDEQNRRALESRIPQGSHSTLIRLSDYCTASTCDAIPDPYYGTRNDFEHVLDLLEDACATLLQEIALRIKEEE